MDTTVREEILLVEFGEKTESALTESDNLDRGTISWSRGLSLVTGFLRRSHFVHPRTTVGVVATEYKTGVRVNADLIVEATIGHLLVDLPAGVSLAEA